MHEPTSFRFKENAREALGRDKLRAILRTATSRAVSNRVRAAQERPDWEELRSRGREIKIEAISHLDRYLEELEAKVTAQGGTVFGRATPGKRATTFWASAANTASRRR